MKIGDLVRWTYPGAENHGLIVDEWQGQWLIMWFDGNGDGPYPKDHENLETVQ